MTAHSKRSTRITTFASEFKITYRRERFLDYEIIYRDI